MSDIFCFAKAEIVSRTQTHAKDEEGIIGEKVLHLINSKHAKCNRKHKDKKQRSAISGFFAQICQVEKGDGYKNYDEEENRIEYSREAPALHHIVAQRCSIVGINQEFFAIS